REGQWQQHGLVDERYTARGAPDLGDVEEVVARVQLTRLEAELPRAERCAVERRVRDGGRRADRRQVLGLQPWLGTARADVDEGQLGAEQSRQRDAGTNDLAATLALSAIDRHGGRRA